MLVPCFCRKARRSVLPNWRSGFHARLSRLGAQLLESSLQKAGLGLGGVTIMLESTDTTGTLDALTNGDGLFRFLDLAPGSYHFKIAREGFLPLEESSVRLVAGEAVTLMLKMQIVAPIPESVPELPRLPDLGPMAPPAVAEPSSSTAGRILRSNVEVAVDIAPSAETLPPEARVFQEIPNRWGYDFPAGYRRYANSDGRYAEGHPTIPATGTN
jgi:hypothetical protein